MESGQREVNERTFHFLRTFLFFTYVSVCEHKLDNGNAPFTANCNYTGLSLRTEDLGFPPARAERAKPLLLLTKYAKL